MNLITVPLSPIIRERLARVSEKSGLSPATLIRHAVKKQLRLWEADCDGSAALADGMNASKTAARRVGQKIRGGKCDTHNV
jgi:hypothetical protein